MKILFLLMVSALFCSECLAEIKAEGLSNETALGIVLTSGNTDVKTVNLSQLNTYDKNQNIYKFNLNYLRSSNQGNEQALLWGLGLRYERELNARFSLFASQSLMSDFYQGIVQRYSTDLGGKYSFSKKEAINWYLEAGYRYSRENYRYGFKNISFIRLFHEIERQIDKQFSVKWWVEYLPNIIAWKAYQANTEGSVAMVLNDIFSLKSSYSVRYYNEPPLGVDKRTDQTFMTALVAKF